MKAYYCVGGPLDGEYATSKDFYGDWRTKEKGMYAHLYKQYSQFNGCGGRCTMLWIHVDLMKPGINPKNR